MFSTKLKLQGLASLSVFATALMMSPDAVVGQVDFDGGAGADTSWNNGLNWAGDSVPTNAQTARLDSGDVVTVDSNAEVGNVDSTDASIDLASGILDVGGILDFDSTTVSRSGGSYSAGSLIVSGTTTLTYEGA